MTDAGNLPSSMEKQLSTPSLLKTRLSIMMFLQYAIWGAWLPLLYAYLDGPRGFSGGEIGTMFAIGAVGALVAPFIAGQIADRFFATEKYLALSHIAGAVLVWFLASVETFQAFLWFSLAYSLIYSPTLPLTNSLSFHHLPDRDRDFGRVRVWGTVGWIVVGIMIGQWLLYQHTPADDELNSIYVETVLSDADERARMRSYHVVTVTNAAGEEENVTGVIAIDTGDEFVLNVDSVDENGAPVAEPRTFDRGDIVSTTPLYATFAAEGKSNAFAEAMNMLDVDDSEDNLGIVSDSLIAGDVLSDDVLNGVKSNAQKEGMADSFRLSAILGLLMGLFCFTLPHTPPSRGEQANATFEAIGEIKYNPLLMLFLIAVPISCIHQFYFVHTAPFLGNFQSGAAEGINKIFGVGGGGLMTIGQMSEILVLAAIPLVAKSMSRKSLLAIGIIAYAARMALFAYSDAIHGTTGIPEIAIVIAGVALHGLCFGCFIFVAFMVVDEETSPDVRASAQSLFNLVIIGIGIIVGSYIATGVGEWAKDAAGDVDYTKLFSVPMWGAVGCLVWLLLLYPRKGRRAQLEAADPAAE